MSKHILITGGAGFVGSTLSIGLKNKYPDLTIGLSTHEYHDWHSSMYISYAKGVRTWERHIEFTGTINSDNTTFTRIC